jgi:hypothetical protein
MFADALCKGFSVTFHAIALHGLPEVAFQAQVDDEGIAHCGFLRRYTVVSVENQVL